MDSKLPIMDVDNQYEEVLTQLKTENVRWRKHCALQKNLITELEQQVNALSSEQCELRNSHKNTIEKYRKLEEKIDRELSLYLKRKKFDPKSNESRTLTPEETIEDLKYHIMEQQKLIDILTQCYNTTTAKQAEDFLKNNVDNTELQKVATDIINKACTV